MTSSTPRAPLVAPGPHEGLTRFNSLPADTATTALHEVCSSTAWAQALAGRRPYATVDQLLAASDTATAGLTSADLAAALAGHPPIGRPEPRDAASAREQRGMADASAQLRQQMADLNLAYRKKFGHVFLICATGRTGEQLRDALTGRIGNSPERERDIVRTELAKIHRIRLARLVEAPQERP